MTDPLDRPHDLSPQELETLLGRGAMDRWESLAPGDRDRLSRDLEALQRTAREIANATRQLHDDVAELEDGLTLDDSTRHPRESGDPD